MYRPGGKRSSVRYNDTTRLDVAKEQNSKCSKSIEEVIACVNKCLVENNIKAVESPITKLDNGKFANGINKTEFYKNLQQNYNLRDKRDLVWIKFTDDLKIVTVATSNDINLQMPIDRTQYKSKKYNTSGIIMHRLGFEYNKDFLLVFPLTNLGVNVKRGEIEKKIGDYLIANDFPIIDFYSHRY